MRKSIKRITPYIIIAILLFFVTAVAIFLVFGLKGETKTSGKLDDAESSESITCIAENLSYPYFTYDNADSKSIKITMVFSGNNLASIYLAQEMRYSDKVSAGASEAVNHASMNKVFNTGYGPDAFNASYYIDDNLMRMTLYTEANKLTEDAKKFFLASNTATTKSVLTKNYEAQGFTCKENN